MSQEQEYISVGEAATKLGIDRSTLYHHLKRLKIQTEKFPFDRTAYITRVDFERIKTFKEQAEQRKASRGEPLTDEAA